jgi:hypothetical protein
VSAPTFRGARREQGVVDVSLAFDLDARARATTCATRWILAALARRDPRGARARALPMIEARGRMVARVWPRRPRAAFGRACVSNKRGAVPGARGGGPPYRERDGASA